MSPTHFPFMIFSSSFACAAVSDVKKPPFISVCELCKSVTAFTARDFSSVLARCSTDEFALLSGLLSISFRTASALP